MRNLRREIRDFVKYNPDNAQKSRSFLQVNGFEFLIF